jgi:hypothetical protein
LVRFTGDSDLAGVASLPNQLRGIQAKTGFLFERSMAGRTALREERLDLREVIDTVCCMRPSAQQEECQTAHELHRGMSPELSTAAYAFILLKFLLDSRFFW